VLLATAMGVAFGSHGWAAQPTAKAEVVEALLEQSGTDAVIHAFLANVEQEMEVRAPDFAGDEAAYVNHAFGAAFDEAAMRARVAETMLARYDDALAREALAWFESPTGTKIRKEESWAQSPEAATPMLEYIAALETDPMNPDRLAIAAEIDRARGSAALSHALLVAFMRGLSLATVGGAEGLGNQPSEAEIDASLSEQLEPLKTTLAEQMIVFYAFMGRNLSLTENKAYLEQLRSDSGQWFYREMSSGLGEAMARAGRAFGVHVATRLEAVQAEREAMQSQSIEADRATTTSEARAFGAGHRAPACIDETAVRRRACADAVCVALVPAFAAGCFAAAAAAGGAGECRDVPDPLDTAETVFWRVDTCGERDRNDVACHVALAALQDYCAGAPAASGPQG